MARSTFRRGSSTFACNVCGRRTREVNSVGHKSCPQCYDLAGIENEISDGHCTRDERQGDIDQLVAEVAAKGGDAAEWAHLKGGAR